MEAIQMGDSSYSCLLVGTLCLLLLLQGAGFHIVLEENYYSAIMGCFKQQ